MNVKADVSTCANPTCREKFVRLGSGELFVFPITDPQAWGLSLHVKQKVIWLCDSCCSHYYVRIDRRHHSAQLVRKSVSSKVA
ncbi:MAG TPA: hypothetical protein VMU28_01625 [Terriglobales bacterium]|nr:hypothetical protein [Terriglobales bacterium]